MTISYNWLKEYIDLLETPEEVASILTGTGLEVESITPFESIPGGLKGVLIGEVTTCQPHPDADKLSVTTVDVGLPEHLQIVCGAPNVAVGQKVLVAMVGTTIFPTQGEPLTIKKAKIRGVASEGMICAEDELGLGTSHAGILILDTSKPNGTTADQVLDVYTDSIFEIGLTPNRADAASHLGVARDLRAVTTRDLKWPSVDQFSVDNTALHIPVRVENSVACTRYSAVTISGVSVDESPSWLKNKLKSIGLTPINNIVDITNFICHEMGQPLHAFDADNIDGKQVVVKNLSQGTKFVTLDGKERSLQASDLMICNTTKRMCIAGVFGGIHSGVKSTTTNIFLESAHFSADSIRRTSSHHQLKTDATFRFERGTDPEITVYALKRAALLIKELAGGLISSEIIDVYPKQDEPRKITIKDKHVERLIGQSIPRERIFSILQRLDIQVTVINDESYEVTVPSYRIDVVQEADIVEEILRIYGYDNLELKAHPGTTFIADFPAKEPHQYKQVIDELLTSNGFFEIWTNSLTSEAYQIKHSLNFDGEPVRILNKLSEEQGILRQTLLFTGLEVCAYNINRKQKDLKLYEFGKTYTRIDDKHVEEEHLAIYMGGLNETENWQHPSHAVRYHDLAQQVHHILIKSGIKNIKTEILHHPLFAYGKSIRFNNKEIGKLGLIKKALIKDFGIKQDLFYAELNTALLFRAANPKLAIKEVPKFPEVRRDISLVIDKGTSFDQIKEVVEATEKKLIKEVIVFDVYEGDKVPEEKKAYAMAFTLQDEHKTLTDKEIDKTMNRLMAAFEKQLGAVIRK